MLRHQETDFFLARRSRIHNAGDPTTAEDKNFIAELKQYVQILADKDNGNALLFLLGH